MGSTSSASGEAVSETTSFRANMKRRRAVSLVAGLVVVLAACSASADADQPTTATWTTVTRPTAASTTTTTVPGPKRECYPGRTKGEGTMLCSAEGMWVPTTAPPITEPPPTQPPMTTEPPPPPPPAYTATNVVDGDTIEVAGSDGSAFKVRVIGIDTPEMDTCEGRLAQEDMQVLVGGKEVLLTPGGDGEDTDSYGRLLRYVDVPMQFGIAPLPPYRSLLVVDEFVHPFPGSLFDPNIVHRDDVYDAGYLMIEWGMAKARYDSQDGYGRHDREASYRTADDMSWDMECANGGGDDDGDDGGGDEYYENCDDVRAARADPIYDGDPGWQPKFDRDQDGVGCE
jgi:endonuclease YncB( thermonuclease family)